MKYSKVMIYILLVLFVLYIIGARSQKSFAKQVIYTITNDREKLSLLNTSISTDDYDLKNCHFLQRIDGSKLLFCISKIKGNVGGFHSKDTTMQFVVVERLDPGVLAHEFLHSETRYWADKGYNDIYDPRTQEKWAYSVQSLVDQALQLANKK